MLNPPSLAKEPTSLEKSSPRSQSTLSVPRRFRSEWKRQVSCQQRGRDHTTRANTTLALTGNTRFATQNRAAEAQLITADPAVAAITVIEGDASTFEQCRAVLANEPKGKKKAQRYIASVDDDLNAFHMALAVDKHKLCIWPVMSTSAVGEHCAAPLMGGQFGVIQQVERRIKKSVITLSLVALRRRNPEYYSSLLSRLRGSNRTSFVMPETMSLPRLKTWARACRSKLVRQRSQIRREPSVGATLIRRAVPASPASESRGTAATGAFSTGDKIEMRYQSGKTYYPGKIERDCGDGTYDIVCCDPEWVVNLSAAIACRIITRWVPTITTEFEERIASQNTRPERRAVELSCAAMAREYVYNVGTHSDRSDGSVSASVSDPRRSSGTSGSGSSTSGSASGSDASTSGSASGPVSGSSDSSSESSSGSSSGSGPSALVLTAGDKIEARFFKPPSSRVGRYYPGRVRRVNSDQSADIEYDDGMRQASVDRTWIRARPDTVPVSQPNRERILGTLASYRSTAPPLTALRTAVREGRDLCVTPIAPLQPRPNDVPTFATKAEVIEARRARHIFDGLTSDERSRYPNNVRKLLENGSQLRRELDDFCKGEVNPETGWPWSLRHWKALHEHLHAFCGALMKTTSIEREWSFSVVKNYILKGNYNVTMERLSIQIAMSAGGLQLDDITQSDRARAKELRKTVETWRPQPESGPQLSRKERNLLYANFNGALKKLTFKEMAAAANDVTVLLDEFLTAFDGNPNHSRFGVLKLGALIRSFGVAPCEKLRNDQRRQLVLQWEKMKGSRDDTALRAMAQGVVERKAAAAKRRTQLRGKKRKQSSRSDGGSDDDDSDDGGGADDAEGKLDDDQLALPGRKYDDTQDGGTWCILRVDFDDEHDCIMAFIYDAARGVPSSVKDCEYVPADELMDSEWAEWSDGRPGRLSREARGAVVNAAVPATEPTAAESALEGRRFTADLDDEGTDIEYTIFRVARHRNEVRIDTCTHLDPDLRDCSITRMTVCCRKMTSLLLSIMRPIELRHQPTKASGPRRGCLFLQTGLLGLATRPWPVMATQSGPKAVMMIMMIMEITATLVVTRCLAILS